MDEEQFEPTIVAFLCRWCAYTGADLAGTSRATYPANVTPIRVMCSGRVDPTFVIKALANGADGVLIAGCHPGDCHYEEGNLKTMRRYPALVDLLEQFGIEKDRIRLEWISASEGEKFASVVKELTDRLRSLGPLNWNGTPSPEMVTASVEVEEASVHG
jgi:F420-non-reducing hydrogenase iron-sulfur subunit